MSLTLALLDFNCDLDFDFDFDLDWDFDFVFDFDIDFDFGALQNTSQTVATMAIVTLPKRRRTPLPLRFMLPPCARGKEYTHCQRYAS